MDWIIFIGVSIALIVGLIKLLKWAQRQDTEARGHERIRNKRQRGQVTAVFEDIIATLRKQPPNDA